MGFVFRHFLIVTLLSITGLSLFAQPCMSSWDYRAMVVVDNSAGAAKTNFQVKLNLNTQDLISNGKMNSDGSDIRFKDKNGNDLSFWFDEKEINQNGTNIWLKLGSLAASVRDTVYLFYGNTSAVDARSAITTFEYFDPFDGAILNPLRWEKCGGGALSVNNGKMRMISSSATGATFISTKSGFSNAVVVEAAVDTAFGGHNILGQINASGNGWAMAYEKINPSLGTMRLVDVSDSNSLSICKKTADQTVKNAVASGNVPGVWSCTWFNNDSLLLKWPGGNASRTDNKHNAVFSQNRKIVIGNTQEGGTIQLDWIRVRKYDTNEPVLSIALESKKLDTVITQNNGPLCQGDTLKLSAPTYIGVSYNWFGPNGFSSTEQNPRIPNISSLDSGEFVLQVSSPLGCPSIDFRTSVNIYDSSSTGIVTGNANICATSNSGSIGMSGFLGQVTQWQSSSSSNGPWQVLSTVDTMVTYNNLPASQYYRVAVKNGVCPAKISQSVSVHVDDSSRAGSLLGTTDVCINSNSGKLELINYQGTVTNWLFSNDTGQTWNNLTNALDTFRFSNLQADRWYSAVVKNGVCASDTSSLARINVYPLPSARFFADSVCLGQTIQFSDSSSIQRGSISSQSWEFLAGQGSTLKHPVFTFSTAGTFPVKLKLTNQLGCSDSVTNNVVVYPNPVARFSHVDACDTVAATFTNNSNITTGSIIGYKWFFGDGDSSLARDTNHVYPTNGIYTATMIVSSDKGCADTSTGSVNIWPRVNIAMQTDSVCVGETISFVNRSTTTASSVSYRWDFGDLDTSIVPFPAHKYARADTFEVILSSLTNNGCRDVGVDTVVIYPLPVANFDFDDKCLGEQSIFINKSSVLDSIITNNWDFGNGQSSTKANDTISYSNFGQYRVELAVESFYGCKSDTSKFINIRQLPTAAFQVDNTCALDTVRFKNNSFGAGQTLSYNWIFGDGDSSTENQAKHVYKIATDYTTKLEVTNQFGCLDSAKSNLKIYNLPRPVFTADSVCFGNATSFNNSSSVLLDSIVGYKWTFEPDEHSTQENPQYGYLSAGIYRVNLEAITNRQCKKDSNQFVVVYEVPIADYEVSDVCFGNPVQFKNETTPLSDPLTYLWEFGDNNSDSTQSIQYEYELPGFYKTKLTVTSIQNCTDTLRKFVEVFALPTVDAGEDFVPSKGIGEVIKASADSGFYSWTPIEGLSDPNVLQPTIRANETNTYQLLVSDKNNCVSTSSVTISPLEDFILTVYNIITPDGNGENDFWYIDNIDAYPEAEVRVYDKSGFEVFSSKEYNNDWEGTFKNDPLPDGTYYYHVVSEALEKEYKGSLTILRKL